MCKSSHYPVYRKPSNCVNLFLGDPGGEDFVTQAELEKDFVYKLVNTTDFDSYRALADEALDRYREEQRKKKEQSERSKKKQSDGALPNLFGRALNGRTCSPERRSGNRGAPSFDTVYMLILLAIQCRLGLSDERFVERLRCDLKLHMILGISRPDEIPSPRTMWYYRNAFVRAGTFERMFLKDIEEIKTSQNAGKDIVIIDSSFLIAPAQHMTKEENELVKEGKGADLWPELPNKRRHKDTDARWTKKGNQSFYGYKGHFLVCGMTKLMLAAHSTPASVHDAKAAEVLIERLSDFGNPAAEGRKCGFFADAGYDSQKIVDQVEEKGYTSLIIKRIRKDHPLPEEQEKFNRKLSKIRVRVEHAFGFFEGTMGGFVTRAIGADRAKAVMFLMSWTYNRCRLALLEERRKTKTACNSPEAVPAAA